MTLYKNIHIISSVTSNNNNVNASDSKTKSGESAVVA